MKKTIDIFLFSLLYTGGVMLFGCGENTGNKDSQNVSEQQDQLTGSVSIDGSSTVYPITEAIAEEYRNEQPKVKVSIGISGTGGGFKKFCRGESDINDASRPIKDKEASSCTQKNIHYLELTVAYDGLAVVAHPENDWLDYITVEELKKIWEPSAQGTLTKWNQIRPEWPDETINLYGPGIASGTYDYFTEVIIGESGSSRGDYTASEDDNILVQGVSTDKFSLGFFGLAYYEENAEKMRLIPVKSGEKEPVLPSVETVKNGSYEPLSRPVFIYVSESSAKKPQVKSFVDFYLENVSEIAADVGYIPLEDKEYDMQLKKFSEFISELP